MIHIQYPCEPIRLENDVPFFTSEQLQIYGRPEHYGFDFNYHVIESNDFARPVVMDWQMEMERKLRPIHRYKRTERFKSIVFQLLAARGHVDPEIISIIKLEGYDKDERYIWNSIRAILKKHGKTKLYNRIPTILEILGYNLKINFNGNLISELLNDFQKISYYWDNTEKTRKYFPNLRFIAFKLMEWHSTEFQYTIPFCRTPSRLIQLEELWDNNLVEVLYMHTLPN